MSVKKFQISYPNLQIPSANEQAKSILSSSLTIKFQINQTEVLSTTTSKLVEDTKIQWEETFAFGKILDGENIIQTSIYNGQGDIIMCFQGELDVKESYQVITTQWNDQKVVIDFELLQLDVNTGRSQKLKTTIQDVEAQDERQEEQKEIEESEEEQDIYIQREIKNTQFKQCKRRQTQDELNLGSMFIYQKERARMIAKDFLRKIAAKIQKKMEVKKSDRSFGEQKRRQTLKESKQNSDRNKENQLFHQRIDKNLMIETEDQFFRSTSPKQSMINSQSLSKSQLRDEIKLFRSRFGDKIYENQNSTTMQKSILCFSVPKGPRFRYSKYNGVEPSYYVGTCFSSSKNKGTSFGFGTRKPYPQWMVRNMHENPAPNNYTVNQPPVQPSASSKGFSFGISYKYYQKTSIVGTQCSKKGTPKAGMFPKLSKPSTSNACRTPTLDSSKGHYHYRTAM